MVPKGPKKAKKVSEKYKNIHTLSKLLTNFLIKPLKIPSKLVQNNPQCYDKLIKKCRQNLSEILFMNEAVARKMMGVRMQEINLVCSVWD